MPKSSEYWKQRFDQVEQSANNRSVKYTKQLEKKYQTAAQQLDKQINAWYQRIAVNNEVTITEARKLLSDAELKEFKWTVEDYIKYGQQNAVDQSWMKELENASAKFHINRLEAMKLEARQQVEQLFAGGQEAMYDTLADVYKDTFYRSCFEIQKGVGVGFDVSKLDDKQVSTLLKKPWSVDGTNFSTKLWGNKRKLINTLDQELSRMVLTGESPKNAIANIRKAMDTSQYAAKRLVLTEQAYFTTVAQKNAYGELDVEEYEIVATLDNRTSDICQKMDGQHFPLKDMQPGVNAPPFHVFCRTTTCPYFNDEFTVDDKRVAKDEETGQWYEVPANMTYPEWKKSFVDGGSKENLLPYNLQFFSANYGCVDITSTMMQNANKKNASVNELKEVKINGTKYVVDGKHVVLRHTKNEIHVAKMISNKLGCNVQLHPQILNPQNISTPDYLVNGIGYDLKSLSGTSKNLLYNAIKGKGRQAKNFIFDVSECPLHEDNIFEQAENLYSSSHMLFLDTTMIVKNDSILKILKRK